MKTYTFWALIFFICGLVGVGLSLAYLEPAAQLGGSSISVATFHAIAAAFFFKRKFSTREIKFINKDKKEEKTFE